MHGFQGPVPVPTHPVSRVAVAPNRDVVHGLVTSQHLSVLS